MSFQQDMVISQYELTTENEIESISYTMSKSTHNEEWHTEQQG
jgi:hypothetical protein